MKSASSRATLAAPCSNNAWRMPCSSHGVLRPVESNALLPVRGTGAHRRSTACRCRRASVHRFRLLLKTVPRSGPTRHSRRCTKLRRALRMAGTVPMTDSENPQGRQTASATAFAQLDAHNQSNNKMESLPCRACATNNLGCRKRVLEADAPDANRLTLSSAPWRSARPETTLCSGAAMPRSGVNTLKKLRYYAIVLACVSAYGSAKENEDAFRRPCGPPYETLVMHGGSGYPSQGCVLRVTTGCCVDTGWREQCRG